MSHVSYNIKKVQQTLVVADRPPRSGPRQRGKSKKRGLNVIGDSVRANILPTMDAQYCNKWIMMNCIGGWKNRKADARLNIHMLHYHSQVQQPYPL